MLNTVAHILRSDFLKGIRLNGQLRSCFAAVHTQTPQHKEQQCFSGSLPPVYRSVSVTLQPLHNHQTIRGKSKKSGKRETRATSSDDLDDDDPEQDTGDAYDDMLGGKYSQTSKVKVNSLRADLILKAGLGIARNKVDTLFYDSKIRVNGKKLAKKSAQLEVNDEIDVVREPSPTNPDHLIVSRVEIVSVTPQAENLSVVLRRHKSLTIENYPEGSYGSSKDK